MNYKPYIYAAACLFMLWCGYDAGKAVGRQDMQKEVQSAKLEADNMKRRAQEAANAHAKQMSEASRMYQQEKAELEARQQERIRVVQKVVEKPVYRTDCIDREGLDEINKVIKKIPVTTSDK